MIRTAIPFGYIFIAIFLLAGFGFGFFCFIWGWRKHSRAAKWFGGGIIILVCAFVVAELFFEDNLDWNPSIKDDAEIAGAWVGRKEALTLSTNKTFDYHSADRAISGTWSRDDWNLYLHGSNLETTMRFVQFRSRYRLMTHPTDDPDMWDGNLGLHRK